MYPRAVAVVVLLALCGCAPAAFLAEPSGGIAGSEVARTRMHEAATARFRASNTARAMNAMPLLDSCSERYWVDRDWARNDPRCAARIRRYENGDSTALDPPGLPVPTTRPTVTQSMQAHYDSLDAVREKQQWKYKGQGAPRR